MVLDIARFSQSQKIHYTDCNQYNGGSKIIVCPPFHIGQVEFLQVSRKITTNSIMMVVIVYNDAHLVKVSLPPGYRYCKGNPCTYCGPHTELAEGKSKVR